MNNNIPPMIFSEGLNDETNEKQPEDPVEPIIFDLNNCTDLEYLSDKEDSAKTATAIETDSSSSSIFMIFILSILLLFVVGISYDASMRIMDMFSKSPPFAWIYLAVLIVIAFIAVKFTVKQIVQLVHFRDAQKLQEMGARLKEKPGEEAAEFAEMIIKRYKDSPIKEVRDGIRHLKESMNTSIIYDDILKRINTDVLNPIDKAAKYAVIRTSQGNAILTAITPVPILSVLIVITRNASMIKEVASLYGFKPGFLGSLLIFKYVAVNIVFAGTAELANEPLTDILGASIIGKISYRLSQGIANGILGIRTGIATISVCRPIPFAQKERPTLFREIFSSLKGILYSKAG